MILKKVNLPTAALQFCYEKSPSFITQKYRKNALYQKGRRIVKKTFPFFPKKKCSPPLIIKRRRNKSRWCVAYDLRYLRVDNDKILGKDPIMVAKIALVNLFGVNKIARVPVFGVRMQVYRYREY